MGRGRQEGEWERAASVMALIANVNRDPKKKASPFRAADFNPFREGGGRGGIPITADNIGELKILAEKGKQRNADSS